MNMQEIERALRELRLSGIAANLSTRVMQLQSTQEPFLDTFAAMLQDGLDRRRSRLTERRFKQSRLDERPTLADFDWRFNPSQPCEPPLTISKRYSPLPSLIRRCDVPGLMALSADADGIRCWGMQQLGCRNCTDCAVTAEVTAM
jgi:hypothetical protein